MPDDDELSDDAATRVLFASARESASQQTPLPSRLTGGQRDIGASPQASQPTLNDPVILGATGGGGVFALDVKPSSTAPQQRQQQAVPRPFEVVAPTTPNTSIVRVKIYAYSYLLKSLAINDQLSVGGLNADFTINVGNRIWIELSVSNYSPGSASIGADGKGDSWGVYPAPGAWTGDGSATPYNQTKAYLLLAECVASTDPRPGKVFSAGGTSVKVLQKLAWNLVIFNTTYGGRSMVYFMPHPGPSLI